MKKIVLKPADKIRFLRRIKVSIKHYNIICIGIKYSGRDLLRAVINNAWPET